MLLNIASSILLTFSEKMAANINPYNFVPILLLLPAFFLNTKLSLASNSLSLGQSLSGNQTLISKDGTFALGFFTPGKSHKFYIGVWYNKLPGQTIVWVANRRSPISDPATSKLQISDLGNLVLLNSFNSPVWSSDSTAKVNVAILLDTGNLVLRNDSSSEVDLWQSFAHPTDTWMPGGWLGVNKITGEYQSLISWKSTEDPAPGLFGESMNPDGSNEYVLIWNGSNIYWSSGLWNDQYFSNVPGTRENTAFNFTFVDNKEKKFAQYTMKLDSILTRFVVNPEGQGLQWFWMNNTQQWQTEFLQPLAHCDVYSLCGPFGICDEKNPDSICRCAEGFEPASEEEWANSDWSSGCARKSQLQCEKDKFLPLSNMRLPANSPQRLNATNEVDCQEACLNDCSCTAYVYGAGCSIWKGELRNLQQPNDGGAVGGTLNLRLVASDIPSSSSSNTNVVAVVLGAVGGVVVIFAIALCLIWLLRRRKRRAQAVKVEGSLVQFSYSDLQRITKNFTEKIGSGGFGSVFKGTLANSTPVAVKKLEDALQGEKQFRAEVRTLGAIQHVNLVRLYGFCSEGKKRLLVYEYMPRSSLDSNLFGNGSTELNWELRFQIILGTARALAYLHEECRECIVHCDVKPGNVLLDEEYNPKVSDFGMAKLIGRDFSKALTTMRGTVGYLAPEWIAGLPITPKVDVYSYGMMVFEVVSGKRNIMHSEDGSLAFYPSWAARKILEGDVESLLDNKLNGVDLEQLTRVCRVACWCIQDLEDLRPAMGQVVQILEGALEVNISPLPAVNLMTCTRFRRRTGLLGRRSAAWNFVGDQRWSAVWNFVGDQLAGSRRPVEPPPYESMKAPTATSRLRNYSIHVNGSTGRSVLRRSHGELLYYLLGKRCFSPELGGLRLGSTGNLSFHCKLRCGVLPGSGNSCGHGEAICQPFSQLFPPPPPPPPPRSPPFKSPYPASSISPTHPTIRK